MHAHKRILAANWKMNLSLSEAVALVKEFGRVTTHNTEIWLASPGPYLASLKQSVPSPPSVRIGAQNCFGTSHGAFTGENSVSILKSVGCDFTLVGHSERRHVFHESMEECGRRAHGVLTQELDIIFCIGETLEQRKSGNTLKVLQQQLLPLQGAPHLGNPQRFVLAYEPVWAIGTGVAAQPKDIKETHAALAQTWKDIFKLPVPRILYGGSVSPSNYPEILEVPLVSGALVGKASLEASSFLELLKISESFQ